MHIQEKSSPHFDRQFESSPEAMSRNALPIGSKRPVLLILVASALLLWLLFPKARPLRQTDRIPFSHDAVEE